jgi:hypothetical protein
MVCRYAATSILYPCTLDTWNRANPNRRLEDRSKLAKKDGRLGCARQLDGSSALLC